MTGAVKILSWQMIPVFLFIYFTHSACPLTMLDEQQSKFFVTDFSMAVANSHETGGPPLSSRGIN